MCSFKEVALQYSKYLCGCNREKIAQKVTNWGKGMKLGKMQTQDLMVNATK